MFAKKVYQYIRDKRKDHFSWLFPKWKKIWSWDIKKPNYSFVFINSVSTPMWMWKSIRITVWQYVAVGGTTNNYIKTSADKIQTENQNWGLISFISVTPFDIYFHLFHFVVLENEIFSCCDYTFFFGTVAKKCRRREYCNVYAKQLFQSIRFLFFFSFL